MIFNLIMELACAFLGTVGFAIMFNVPKKFYTSCGFTGAAGWLGYWLVEPHASAAVASFCGTLIVVLVSRALTVKMRCPITIFLVAGILPMVPGAGVYYTAYYFVTNQLAEATVRGMSSIKTAFAMVLAIVIVVAIPREFFEIQYWLQKLRFIKLRRLRMRKKRNG